MNGPANGRRCHDCGTSRGELNGDRIDPDGRSSNVICLRCYLKRHADDPSVPETARRNVSSIRKAKPVSAGRLFDRLAAIDLSPIIVDEKAPLVRCLCPVCGSPDTEGMWRSLLIDGRHGIAAVCEGGCRHEKVVAALRALLNPERSAHVG